MLLDQLTRREALQKTGILSLSALTWPAWMPRVALRSPAAASTGDVLVVVFMRGGLDGLNVLVPYGAPEYYTQRESIAISEPKAGQDKSALDLDGFFGLNPTCKALHDLYTHKVLAAVHAVGSPDPTHSHFEAMDYMERGTPGEKAIPTGWIGRHLQVKAADKQSPFRAVGFGGLLQPSLRGPITAVALQSIADFHLRSRRQELDKIQATIAALYAGDDLMASQGQQTLSAVQQLTQIADSTYEPATGAKYPQSSLGRSLKATAQLIKADIGLEVACADIGGFDTHADQGGADGHFSFLLGHFADALQAFYTDLQDRMGHITLVTMTEFGRRLRENSSAGTDHGHGSIMFVLGGNVNGGKVYTRWPGLSQDELYGPGDLAVTTDFRDVIGEIVQKRLGNSNLAAVFPHYSDFHMHGLLR